MLDHVGDVGGSDAAIGAIEIVKLGQRLLAGAIADHHDAGKPVDRSEQPDPMIWEVLPIVADQRVVRDPRHVGLRKRPRREPSRCHCQSDRAQYDRMRHDATNPHCATTPPGAVSRLNAAANKARV